MRVDEFILSFNPNQKVAVVSDSGLIWAGSVSNFNKSTKHDTISTLTVKHVGLHNNVFETYYGGESQEWDGLIIRV